MQCVHVRAVHACACSECSGKRQLIASLESMGIKLGTTAKLRQDDREILPALHRNIQKAFFII